MQFALAFLLCLNAVGCVYEEYSKPTIYQENNKLEHIKHTSVKTSIKENSNAVN